MKQVVYDTHEIPHLWAHQTQSEARNRQGNLYFTGDTIYSYGSHFPIAKHVVSKRGEKAVLFTTGSYGHTTAGHINSVARSIPPDVPVFNVALKSRWSDPEPSRIVTDYTVRIRSRAEAVVTARSTQARKFAALESLIAEANRYCEFSGLKQRFTVPENTDAIKADIAAQAAKDKQQRIRDDAKAKRQAALARKERAKTIERWIAGENVRIPHYWGEPQAYLRIVGDQVETSQGATFPVEHALRVIPIIRRIRESGTEYHRNGHTIHLGHYPLDHISAKGDVRAGCHLVEYAEVERIAGLLEKSA